MILFMLSNNCLSLKRSTLSHQMPGGELRASIALAFLWSADLRRDFLPSVARRIGFGASVASPSLALVRAVATFAERRGDYLILDDTVVKSSADRPKRRSGFPRHLQLKQLDFKTVLSVRAKNLSHNNVLEAETYLLWLRWLLRSTKHHNGQRTQAVFQTCPTRENGFHNKNKPLQALNET